MIKLEEISYIAEMDKEYVKVIDMADTLFKLRDSLKEWSPLCEDAYKISLQMNDKRFHEFRKALKKERQGKYAANNDALIIMLPANIFKVSIIANNFKVPWGLAFKRLVETGKIVIKENQMKFVGGAYG